MARSGICSWSVVSHSVKPTETAYVHRGFDDLDWLPDPPIELDPTAGSHHR